jgi:uncharacterized membrane protein YoaK (UPF0700 family)
MENKNHINWVTFLLAWVAGYCDTVTFVSGDSIFSAHVTGNFIVFAAQTVTGGSADSWVKLLTFPVFVSAVIIGGWIANDPQKRYKLLLTEGILLLVSGIAAVMLPLLGYVEGKLCTYLIVMIVVFGMGLQNAFGRLFAKETHGPTTMMTGNVTQASLDIGNLLRGGFFTESIAWQSLKKQGYTIGGFLTGCLLGAVFSKIWGLPVIFLPGVFLLVCYRMGTKSNLVE